MRKATGRKFNKGEAKSSAQASIKKKEEKKLKKHILTLFLSLLLLPVYISGVETLSKNNLVVLIDCSGSMQGEKMEQAKQALKEVLKTVPSSTNIGILMFGKTRGWVYDLGSRDDQRLFNAIDALEAEGSTPLGTYMKIAADRLLKQRKEQMGYGTYNLLVITDGEANDEKKGLVDIYTPVITSRGISVDAIGVFMQEDHTLARKVRSYRKANDTVSLKKALVDVLAEISINDDGSISEDAYKVIEGLSNESAMNILTALPHSSNDPIQETEAQVLQASTEQSPEPVMKPSKILILIFCIVGSFILTGIIAVIKAFTRKQ